MIFIRLNRPHLGLDTSVRQWCLGNKVLVVLDLDDVDLEWRLGKLAKFTLEQFILIPRDYNAGLV